MPQCKKDTSERKLWELNERDRKKDINRKEIKCGVLSDHPEKINDKFL